MNQKIIIPIILIVAIALGIFFYTQYNSKVQEQISIEKERLQEEKNRKEKLEVEIKELNQEIADSKSRIEELNQKVNTINSSTEELKASKNQVQRKLNTYSYLLKKERDKIAKSKNEIVSLINKHLSGLLDHRIRKISIFNDDSSFAYYTGRRNYISLNAKDGLKMERTIHFTSTGQYLQPIYQDKDNGDNRFIINTYNVPLTNLDLSAAKIEDLSKKEKMAFEKDFREETYVNLEVPVKNSSALIELVNTVEYNEKRFDKKSNQKSLDFYTTSQTEAEEVLSLLKILSSLI